jgi:hypothetical protein
MPMDILFHDCYNLDLLNLLNILSGDPIYKKTYPQVFIEFAQPLSLDSMQVVHEISSVLGSTLISPPLAFSVSLIPKFDQKPLLDLFFDIEGFHEALEQNAPRLLAQKDQIFLLFQALAPVIQELEYLGFREYWLSECYPLIEERKSEIEEYAMRSNHISMLHDMFGVANIPEEIHIYLCALSAPNGVRLANHSCITDITFSDQKIFDFALHEIFQSFVANRNSQIKLFDLAKDTFIQLAFDKGKASHRMDTIHQYLQNNIVEAMKIHYLNKGGFLPDPFEFLQNFKQGTYVLSMIFLDHLHWMYTGSESIEVVLEEWLDSLPVGKLMDLYTQALGRAGINLVDY